MPRYMLFIVHADGRSEAAELNSGAHPRFVGEVFEFEGKAWRVVRERSVYASRLVLAPAW